MHRNKPSNVAAIDVGSNSIRMIVAQVTQEGEWIQLDDLLKPTNIGKDSFAYGRIQVDTIHDTCDILNGFLKVMQQYGVKHYRAVCTSGIREAENKEYVLEQIRLRTDIMLEVINNAQERYIMYKVIRDYLAKEQEGASSAGTLIVDIRAGGVEISVYSSGSLKFTEYIKVGSLRLREILADLEQRTLDFPSIMEEFIESRISFLKPLIRQMNISSFIGLGGDLITIADLSFDKNQQHLEASMFISKKDLHNLYLKVHTMTSGQIADVFKLQKSQAGVLLPSIILFYSFLDMTHAQGICTPMVSLRHGLLADIVDERVDTYRKKTSIDDVISSVWYIGQKYHVDRVHGSYVEKLALSIFDQTQKIHRLGERERFYLRVSAILHDIGKYVNLNQHDIHSYNIIRFQDIMSFSNREMDIIANVARYHSEEIPDNAHENYLVLGERDKIIVSKLAAIVKLAEALDLSHKRKIEKINIIAIGKELHFNIVASEDILLEEWSFSSHVHFFEEVMGSKPMIKKKAVY